MKKGRFYGFVVDPKGIKVARILNHEVRRLMDELYERLCRTKDAHGLESHNAPQPKRGSG